MTILHREIPAHWNYFLALEEDVHALSRWIEFSPPNESVYSIELARLLMTAAAEADVVAKALCKLIAPKKSADNINEYQSVLMDAVPIIVASEVTMPRYGLTFHPWSNWAKKDTPPDWWKANNKVKHHRAEHFSKANLKNVLNATAGLLILLLIYYAAKQKRHIFPAPRIYVTRFFCMQEGDALRLIVPDKAKIP